MSHQTCLRDAPRERDVAIDAGPHNTKKLRRMRTELLIRFPGNSVTPARAPAMQGFVDMHSRARRDQRSLARPSVRESDAPHKITGAPLGAWAVRGSGRRAGRRGLADDGHPVQSAGLAGEYDVDGDQDDRGADVGQRPRRRTRPTGGEPRRARPQPHPVPGLRPAGRRRRARRDGPRARLRGVSSVYYSIAVAPSAGGVAASVALSALLVSVCVGQFGGVQRIQNGYTARDPWTFARRARG